MNIIVLMGPKSCGKTTTINIVYDILISCWPQFELWKILFRELSIKRTSGVLIRKKNITKKKGLKHSFIAHRSAL
jgi:ABC-type multidrug transport system ATPase subunit